MNDPATTLKDYIEDNYDLATESVAAEDCTFSTEDYTVDNSPLNPHVIVQLAGFQRLQQAEPSLYEFDFIVSVSVFPKFRKTQAGIDELKGLYWEIVNHLKLMFDSGKPSGWEYAYVNSGANVGITLGTIPNEYVFNLSVKACIGWTS